MLNKYLVTFIALLTAFASSCSATVAVQFSSAVAAQLPSVSPASLLSSLDGGLGLWLDASQYDGPGSDTTDGAGVSTWKNLVNEECSYVASTYSLSPAFLSNVGSKCSVQFSSNELTKFQLNDMSAQFDCAEKLLYNLTQGFTIIAVANISSDRISQIPQPIFTASASPNADDLTDPNTETIQFLVWPANKTLEGRPPPAMGQHSVIIGQHMVGIHENSKNYAFYDFNTNSATETAAPGASYNYWGSSLGQELDSRGLASYAWWVKDGSSYKPPISRTVSNNQSFTQALINPFSNDTVPVPRYYNTLGYTSLTTSLYESFNIAELLLYSRALTAQELAYISDYIAAKYSIPGDSSVILTKLSAFDVPTNASSTAAELNDSLVVALDCSTLEERGVARSTWNLSVSRGVPGGFVTVKSLESGSGVAELTEIGPFISGLFLNSTEKQYLAIEGTTLESSLGELNNGLTVTLLLKEDALANGSYSSENVGLFGFGRHNNCAQTSVGVLLANSSVDADWYILQLGSLSSGCDDTFLESYSFLQPAREEPAIVSLRLTPAKGDFLSVNSDFDLATSTLSVMNSTNRTLTIGSASSSLIGAALSTFHGYISYVAVHNTSLSDESIAELQANVLERFKLKNMHEVSDIVWPVGLDETTALVNLTNASVSATHGYYNSSRMFYNFSANSQSALSVRRLERSTNQYLNVTTELVSQADIDEGLVQLFVASIQNTTLNFTLVYPNGKRVVTFAPIFFLPLSSGVSSTETATSTAFTTSQLAETSATVVTSTDLMGNASPTETYSAQLATAGAHMNTGTIAAISASVGFVALIGMALMGLVVRKRYFSGSAGSKYLNSSKGCEGGGCQTAASHRIERASKSLTSPYISSPVALATVGNNPGQKCPNLRGRDGDYASIPPETATRDTFLMGQMEHVDSVAVLDKPCETIEATATAASHISNVALNRQSLSPPFSPKERVSLIENFPTLASEPATSIPLAASHLGSNPVLNETPTLANVEGEWISTTPSVTPSPYKPSLIVRLFKRA